MSVIDHSIYSSKQDTFFGLSDAYDAAKFLLTQSRIRSGEKCIIAESHVPEEIKFFLEEAISILTGALSYVKDSTIDGIVDKVQKVYDYTIDVTIEGLKRDCFFLSKSGDKLSYASSARDAVPVGEMLSYIEKQKNSATASIKTDVFSDFLDRIKNCAKNQDIQCISR